MSKINISEILKFYVKPLLIVITIMVIFLVILYLFPTFRLTFEEFSLIYWSLSVFALPINYKVKKWTEYAIKKYGVQVEKNPVVRRMYIKRNLRPYWIILLFVYVWLFIIYVWAIYTRSLFYLLAPLILLVLMLYDFFNDFYWLRKFKKQEFCS